MPTITGRETSRAQELRRLLETQRRQVLEDLRLSRREAGSEGAVDDGEVQDEAEQSETDIQTELEFALLQMRSETLTQIDQALERLDANDYGRCMDCGAEIPAVRLRALPFAVRCRRCERTREIKAGRHDHSSTAWRAPVRLLDIGG